MRGLDKTEDRFDSLRGTGMHLRKKRDIGYCHGQRLAHPTRFRSVGHLAPVWKCLSSIFELWGRLTSFPLVTIFPRDESSGMKEIVGVRNPSASRESAGRKAWVNKWVTLKQSSTTCLSECRQGSNMQQRARS